jgi:hypothetical protein
VPYDYLSGERFVFTKHLSAEKLFNPLFSKKMQITIPFLPPNLKELLGLTLSCVKNGRPLSVSNKRQDFCCVPGLLKVYEIILNIGIGDVRTEVFTLQVIIRLPLP